MRVVGYVRERPAAVGTEPAFAQGERIRRWADDHGHDLVALCRDPVRSDDVVGAGFDALVAVVDAGVAATVVVASPSALGDSPTAQEVVLWDLERHGATVAFTTEDSAADATDDTRAAREQARQVLERLAAHEDRWGGTRY